MCKQVLPLDSFGRNKKGEKIIVRSACKACTNAKKKTQRDANPEKVKEILRRSYQKHRAKRLEYAKRKRQERLAASVVKSDSESKT
jgi:acyl-CoA reductase-like NAD-dependent aldehyde dehydrogenase